MDTLALSVDRVAPSLGFSTSDGEAANNAYRRWRESGRHTDKEIVDIWTYCRVARHFQHVARQNPDLPISDRDLLVEQALNRIAKSQHNLRSWDRYAVWVYTVCRNVTAHYWRDADKYRMERKAERVCDGGIDPVGRVARRQCFLDIVEAIGRLPPSLAHVVRLRYLDGLGYDEISRLTGKPIDTVRTYVSRSIARLRNDPDLAEYF